MGAHEEFSFGYFMFEVSSRQIHMFIVQERDWRFTFGSYQQLHIKVVGLEII